MTMMVKKNYSLETESLYGEMIKLTINNYENKQRCAEILLSSVKKEHIKPKAIIACFLAALNLIILHFSLSNPTIYLVIFFAISYNIYKILFKVKGGKF